MGNMPDDLSQGGFVLLIKGQPGPNGSRVGGGAFAWKCEAPPEGDGSFGAAELRMVPRALKYTIAIRTMMRDLDLRIAPTQPKVIYTDAEAVVSGPWSGAHGQVISLARVTLRHDPLGRALQDSPDSTEHRLHHATTAPKS